MKKKIKEQCFVFDVSIFKTKKSVKRWFDRKDKELPKKTKIRKFEKKYRVRIRPQHRFKKRSMKERKLQKGVVVVKGIMK